MTDERRPIVVIRRKKVVRAHTGGSWKIALADFMTAMMALFLVLWLVSTSSPGEMEGIADYFRTPLLVAMAGGDRPTASNSAIPGGGPDPVFSEGETARIDLRQSSRPAEIRRRFRELQRDIQAVMQAEPRLRELRDQLRIYVVPEGLLIQLLDSERRPMYERGSDAVAPYMRELLRSIAPLLNQLPNRINISGHTDSLPYRGDNNGYSNWELSTDRANAARRELRAGGLRAEKIMQVVGMADQVPLLSSEPSDPANRRIELVLLNNASMEQIFRRHTAGEQEALGDT
ncbi:MAG: flagellar motor protein MotB [Pseudohongiellaceae bacterium]